MKKLIFLFVLMALTAACSDDASNPEPEKPTTTLEESLLTHIPLDGEAVGQGSKEINGIVNGASPAEDRKGNSNAALYFDGTNDYVDLGTNIDTDNISTIALWAKFDTLSKTMPDMELISKSSYRQGMEVLIYEGELQFYLVGVEDNNHIGVPVTSLKKNQWYHIVAIYDRAAEQMRLYLDGTLKDSDRAPLSITKIDRLMLGNWSYEAEPRFFKGHLDDISIYNRPLTEEEVTKLYNAE